METNVRSARFRLYPTREQEHKMLQQLEACRQTYNHLIDMCEIYHGFGLHMPSCFDLCAMTRSYRDDHEWMCSTYSSCLNDVGARVHNAYEAFFRRVKNGEIPGHPRFKGRYL